jgi:predicted permease
MPKAYDAAYYQRWYRDARTRVTSDRVLERKVHVALSAAEYMLGRRVRRVLDVGCGEGRWYLALKRMRRRIEYVGVESSDYAVRMFGKSRHVRRGSFGTLASLGLRGPFDLIVCADVLQYVPTPDLRAGLREICRLLGGVAYIEAYAKGDDMVGDMDGWIWRSPTTLRREFREAGLTHCGLYCFIDAEKVAAVNALEVCGERVFPSFALARMSFRLDLRLASRSLSRSPVFVMTTVLSLALGIGASAAAFSVLEAVRFRALPFPNGDRLVVIQEVPTAIAGATGACPSGCDPSYETFAQVLRDHAFHSLDAVAAFTSGAKGLVLGDEIVPVLGGVVSPNVFALLNARPLAGRTFAPEDDRLGVPLTVVLSHALWTSRFAEDPAILGKVVKLSDSRYTVIGIMPAGFEFESGSQFWLPVVPTLDPSTRPSIRNVIVFGRLAPTATIDQLRAELATIAPAAQSTARGQPISTKLVAAPLRDRYVASTQSHDVIFAGVIACVLLIAVANVATLLLVRTLHQERELAVRTALGGGVGNLARFLVTQQALLVAAGAALGVVVAAVLLRVLRTLAVLDSIRPLGMEYRVDGGVAVFAIALSLAIALALGLVPLRIIRSMDVQRVLRESSTGATGGGHGLAQRVFVVAETACAVVLLVGAALMTATVLRLTRVDVGFDASRLVVGTPSFPHSWRVKETYLPVERRILADLSALPGAASVALRASNRLGARGAPGEIRRSGDASPLPPALTPATVVAVNAGYFKTAGIRLVAGREFDDTDRENTAPVAVVNEWVARRWWPNDNAVGQLVRIDSAAGAGVTVTIVGVVRDNKAAQSNVLLAVDGPEVYRPFEQAPSAFPTFIVRARDGLAPETLLRPARQTLIRAVPDRPLFTELVADQVRRQLAGVRTNAFQILGFAVLGLLLALVGVHGVLAYTVSRRTREIGIRGALGASQATIRVMVLRDALILVAVGLLIGLPLAAFAARFIRELLHGTNVADPSVFAAVVAIMVIASLVASWIPARRASRVDPIIALRSS